MTEISYARDDDDHAAGGPEFDDRLDAYLYKTGAPWDIALSRAECGNAARIVPVWFVTKEWKKANATSASLDDSIIDAAEAQAALYEGDDRQDIKTDVMNAFYAGVKFGRSQSQEVAQSPEVSSGGTGISSGDSESIAVKEILTTADAKPVAAQPQDPLCRYPLCQSEAEQDRIAAEVYAELYSGEVQDKPQDGELPLAYAMMRNGKVQGIERSKEQADRWVSAEAVSLAPMQEAPAVPDIKEMINRFLGWKLPKDFAPDCGISFDGRKDDEWNKGKTWPIGTNLLTADQAKAMFLHCLGAAPSAPAGEKE